MISLVLPHSQKVSRMATGIGDRIRYHRRRLGWTQKELAAKVGVSPGTIGMYETNQREPDLQMLRKLAAALGTTVADLIEEPGPSAGREELALHHVDRRHDPNAPIKPSLRERIRQIQDELGRLVDELDRLEED